MYKILLAEKANSSIPFEIFTVCSGSSSIIIIFIKKYGPVFDSCIATLIKEHVLNNNYGTASKYNILSRVIMQAHLREGLTNV